MRALILLFLTLLSLAPGPALAKEAPPPPETQMAAGIIVDSATGKVYWAKAADSPRAPASLTKILAALLIIEKANLEDQVIITPEFIVEGAGTGAQPGWIFTVKDLLYGLMLQSGNDAALALAAKVSPDRTTAGFVGLMNQRARELGAESTTIKNPHGLDEEGHITTAADLALLSIAAMDNDLFRKIVSTRSYDLAWGDGTTNTFYNLNKMLGSYPGAIGVKTGFTTEAGRNLVTAVDREGSRLVAVALGSPDTYAESTALLDWTFTNLAVLRAQPSKFPRTLLPRPNAPDIRGLKVVEFDPGVAPPPSAPPLVAPLAVLLLTLGATRLLKSRRRVAAGAAGGLEPSA